MNIGDRVQYTINTLKAFRMTTQDRLVGIILKRQDNWVEVDFKNNKLPVMTHISNIEPAR